MTTIQINGIRLSHEMIELRQAYAGSENQQYPPVYQTLSANRINMVCVGIHRFNQRTDFSCCLDKKNRDQAENYANQFQDLPAQPITDVCMVSVYPHHSNIRILGLLLELFGQSDYRFRHMVSSNAMISFVIETQYQDSIVSLIEKGFDLPDSHTPFRQEIDEDISQFLKKYPETRASYVEEKIKTYGINLTSGLDLFRFQCTHDCLPQWGRAIQSLEDAGARFNFCSALSVNREANLGQNHAYHIAFLTNALDTSDKNALISQVTTPCSMKPETPVPCDFITFHGPHFGDRYRILHTALSCLDRESIPVLLVGCTGASIGMVLPGGMGEKGQQALGKGFEVP